MTVCPSSCGVLTPCATGKGVRHDDDQAFPEGGFSVGFDVDCQCGWDQPCKKEQDYPADEELTTSE